MIEQKQKKVYFEIMRLVAIFGVYFCHTGTYGMHHYLEANSRANYWLGIFLISITQCCIPLFFMISGGVLLNREESIGYVYRHRVLKMMLATMLAIVIQYFWNYHNNPMIGALNLKVFFYLLHGGGAATQHWFLYSYISFLLFLPFLQKLVKVIPDNWFLYLFVAWEVIHSIFPILEYHQEWPKTRLGLSVEAAVVYSMLGYFLEYRCREDFYRKKNILLVLGGTVLVALLNIHQNHISLQDYPEVQFAGCFVLTYAAAAFVFIKYICPRLKMPSIVQKIICFAGAGVFGTYLLDGILRDVFFPVYLYLNTRIYSYPAVFVWIAVSVLAGIIITNLFKRIPVVGKII